MPRIAILFFIVPVLAVALLLAAGAERAHACSAPYCVEPTLLAAPSMPASLPGLRMTGWGGFDPELSELRVYHVTEAGEVEVTTTPSTVDWALEVTLDEPLVEGDEYRIRGVAPCDESDLTAEVGFVAGAPAPLPAALGELVLAHGGIGDVPIPAGASCYERVTAYYQDVEVALADDAAPWADVLVYTTYVDGAVYAPMGTEVPFGYGDPGTGHAPGGSWYGRGRDRLYTRCGAIPEGAWEEGLAPGAHTVHIAARLAGTELTLATDAIEVWLECPPDECMFGGTAPDCLPPPMDCVYGWDDATGECADAPLCRDGDCDDEPASGASSGGCSAAAAPVTGTTAPAAVLIALMLGLRRRRRATD